jgi:hypothetical protein
MKKALSVFIAVLVFSLIPLFSAYAITVNINGEILNSANITSDTDWITIDLSQYSPWELGIRSLYLAMYAGLRSSCTGNGVRFDIRPFNDDNNIRMLMMTSIHGDPSNTDDYVQYVWLPLNSSNKIQYRIQDLDCSNVDVRLYVLGYDF